MPWAESSYRQLVAGSTVTAVARDSGTVFGNQNPFSTFSCASFDYILLFFLPSARCFSHIAYNSYLLIITIELCGRFLADHSGTPAERFLYGLRFQSQARAVSWELPQTR